ncbi:MAG: hypothetical protein LRZ85_01875 [Alphaproteobacteria bacterium]|nr:hypothetical protein [Alphaproteobacteria bacterium]MCD8526338.1 hypothetical protein [Alphaproteobacteria bacterium]MCD8570144.1 hypothetical protein [Alphaproteobacteria bacterium]
MTKTSVKEYPVEALKILDWVRDMDRRTAYTSELHMARGLIAAGIMDSLLKFQNADLQPGAKDIYGQDLVRNAENPQTVLKAYLKGHMGGVFLTEDNIDQVLLPLNLSEDTFTSSDKSIKGNSGFAPFVTSPRHREK